MKVSIPSRGFWFFEGVFRGFRDRKRLGRVSIPSRGFWFFEGNKRTLVRVYIRKFQSPRGDFGFLKAWSTAASKSPS